MRVTPAWRALPAGFSGGRRVHARALPDEAGKPVTGGQKGRSDDAQSSRHRDRRAASAPRVRGCGGTTTSTPATTSKRKVIGVSLLTQTHAFYKELEAGLREEAAAEGLRPRRRGLRDGSRRSRRRRSRTSSRSTSRRFWWRRAIRTRSCRRSPGPSRRAFPSSPPTSRRTAARSSRTSRATTCRAGGSPPRRSPASWAARARCSSSITRRSPPCRIACKGFEEELKKYPGHHDRREALGGRPAREGDAGHGGHAAGAPRPHGRVRHQRRLGARRARRHRSGRAQGHRRRRLRRDRRGAGGDQEAAARSRPTSCNTPQKIGQTAIDIDRRAPRGRVGAARSSRSMSASWTADARACRCSPPRGSDEILRRRARARRRRLRARSAARCTRSSARTAPASPR